MCSRVVRLVRQLLRRVERDVQPQLQLFLTNILDGKVDSDLEDDYPLLIYQVGVPWPGSCSLPVAFQVLRSVNHASF